MTSASSPFRARKSCVADGALATALVASDSVDDPDGAAAGSHAETSQRSARRLAAEEAANM